MYLNFNNLPQVKFEMLILEDYNKNKKKNY